MHRHRAERPSVSIRARGIARALQACAILLLCAGIVPGARAAGPRLVVEQPEIDIGEVIRGETGRGIFELKNAGDAPLRVTNVQPGCSCTVVDYDRTIAPGATGTLTATLETDGLHGVQARWVRVATDDPGTPEVQLVLRANVVGSVEIFPVDRVRISDRSGGRPVETLLLRKEPGRPARSS